jgi:hypothetical protein
VRADPGLWRDFSLVAGGPLVDIARACRVLPADEHRARAQWYRLGAGAAVAAWLPLFLLAIVDGTVTSGSTVPFLHSLGTHVRLLVAVPLFFFTEATFDRRVRQVVRQIAETQLASMDQLPRLERAVQQARRWRDAWYIEAAIVAITILLLVNGVRTDVAADLSTWRTAGGQRTLAGWWYALVSIPLFQFLIWRWCARMLIWWQLLWRIATLDLRLVPTHPDRAAGLGMLGVAHVTLAPLGFASTAMLVASYVEQLLFGSATVRQVILPLAGWIACATLLVIAPLTAFSHRLFLVKEDGLLTYGLLASSYVQAFDDKWVRQGPATQEALLGSADIQSLADLATSFEIVRTLRLVPIAPLQVLALLLAAIAPTLPLVLFVIPLDELIIRGVQTLLHV